MCLLCLQTLAFFLQSKKIGKEILLNKDGYTDYHRSQPRAAWNDARDYYYGIPIEDLSLNPNLKQNPGWDDITRGE